MKIEQFATGFYRVRDKGGNVIPGIVVGGNRKWSVELRGLTSYGFKSKILAAQYLINCNERRNGNA